MSDERAFLQAIQANPEDSASRLVYADWLEDRGDGRAEFLRLHLALSALPPDHVQRVGGEHELSHLRKNVEPAWLAVVEPERAHLVEGPPQRPRCTCFEAAYEHRAWYELALHTEPQDTECDAWKRLLDLVEDAAINGREEFAPGRSLTSGDWYQIVTLPPTIARLKSVTHLLLYGSHLVRVPPEIGEMTSLERFTPYTSYRLHWFPYEITRCKNLRNSTVSTRALYGNYKYRPPFPRLAPWTTSAKGRLVRDRPSLHRCPAGPIRNCSVCDQPFEDLGLHRAWASLGVATDVLPLLVNACSEECLRALPDSPPHYVQRPHAGGLAVQQPPPR